MKPPEDKVLGEFLRRKALCKGFIPGAYEDITGFAVSAEWLDHLADDFDVLYDYESVGDDVLIHIRPYSQHANLTSVFFPVLYRGHHDV